MRSVCGLICVCVCVGGHNTKTWESLGKLQSSFLPHCSRTGLDIYGPGHCESRARTTDGDVNESIETLYPPLTSDTHTHTHIYLHPYFGTPMYTELVSSFYRKTDVRILPINPRDGPACLPAYLPPPNQNDIPPIPVSTHRLPPSQITTSPPTPPPSPRTQTSSPLANKHNTQCRSRSRKSPPSPTQRLREPRLTSCLLEYCATTSLCGAESRT